jgi:hypothetical protein
VGEERGRYFDCLIEDDEVKASSRVGNAKNLVKRAKRYKSKTTNGLEL